MTKLGLLAIILIAISSGGCSLVNQNLGWENDNPVEEVGEAITNELGEAIIKRFTGHDVDLDLDFTPEDKEK